MGHLVEQAGVVFVFLEPMFVGHLDEVVVPMIERTVSAETNVGTTCPDHFLGGLVIHEVRIDDERLLFHPQMVDGPAT